MNASSVAEIPDLMTAGDAGSHQDIVFAHGVDCRKQSPARNLVRNFEMLLMIAEGPCHSAAAGIEIYHIGRRNARKQRARSRQQPHRFLMTMPVQQNSPLGRL